VRLGDDCAAIPAADGYDLFAIEGLLDEFVAAEPWFAGWCGVMVNVSDVYAMGGRPVAVVDALWNRGDERGRQVWAGLRAASAAYGVPLVGGHTNSRSGSEHLAVAILGRARRLLTSFDARPGDVILLAVDLRGAYHDPYWYWDASTKADPARLRADLEILPRLAEDGLCAAAKDVSMAGVLGTVLMLLECSGVGAAVAVDAVPRPAGVAPDKWLASFPSYGFLLAVPPGHAATVASRFAGRDLVCGAIGRCDGSRRLMLRDGAEEELFWDLRTRPVLGFGPPPTGAC
jgi:AIR synthase-related protein